MALSLAELEALMVPGDLPQVSVAAMIPPRPAWQADAACHGRTSAFFRESTEPTAEAVSLCGGCPVRAECLAYALADPTLEGTWAGTSKRERRAMRRKAS